MEGFFEWGKQKTPEPLGLFLYLSFSPSFPLSFLFSSLPFPISSLQEEKRAFSCFPCSDTGKKSKYFYEKHLFSSMILFLYFTDNPRSLLVPSVGGKHLWIANHSEKGFMQLEEEHNLWQVPAGPGWGVTHTVTHHTPPGMCQPIPAHPGLSALTTSPAMEGQLLPQFLTPLRVPKTHPSNIPSPLVLWSSRIVFLLFSPITRQRDDFHFLWAVFGIIWLPPLVTSPQIPLLSLVASQIYFLAFVTVPTLSRAELKCFQVQSSMTETPARLS